MRCTCRSSANGLAHLDVHTSAGAPARVVAGLRCTRWGQVVHGVVPEAEARLGTCALEFAFVAACIKPPDFEPLKLVDVPVTAIACKNI
jgi:hypothetical protein